MKKIKNVLICGLGGIGCVCASNIYSTQSANLKVLIDEKRWKKYITTPTTFNGKPYNFNYILPSETEYKADLVIIATKDSGLNEAIKNIKNFVNENTVILSLLNGIHSEKEIASVYGEENILYSFYIGASCVRDSRNIIQNGDYNIVIGAKYSYQHDILNLVDKFLTISKIKHYISSNIINEYWKKFMINTGLNQLSAATGKTLKQIRDNKDLTNRMLSLMHESELIAEKEGITEHKEIYNNAVKFLLKELPDANPSMLQDIKAGRKTEVDIFAGKIISLGKKYKIHIKENKEIYDNIKQIEKNIQKNK